VTLPYLVPHSLYARAHTCSFARIRCKCQWTSSQQVIDVLQHVRKRLNLLYGTTSCRLRTPPTDELTTILQLAVQQIHHLRTKICHIPTSRHVEMLGSSTAMWQICCTTSCRIVVSSSIGGVVQHVRSRCRCWWRSIVVRPPVLAGELSLSCARLMAGRVTALWVRCPLSVNQHGQLSLPSLRGRLNKYDGHISDGHKQ